MYLYVCIFVFVALKKNTFFIPGNCFSSKIQHFHFFSPHLWIILTDPSASSLGREAVIGIGSGTARKGRAAPELSGDEPDAGRGFPLWFVFCVRAGVLTVAILRLVELCCVAASRRFSGGFGRRSEVIFNVPAGTAGMESALPAAASGGRTEAPVCLPVALGGYGQRTEPSPFLPDLGAC